MPARYTIKLMFEWGGGCLWPANAAALDRFDAGPMEDVLPISQSLRDELRQMSDWHNHALNWEYPPDPGPWSADEFQRFDSAARDIRSRLAAELGPDFLLVYAPLGGPGD